MVITAHHYRPDFAVSYHFVELQRYLETPLGVLVQDPGLGSNDKPVLLGVADPYPVVVVLPPAIAVNAFHGRLVCLSQVFGIPAQAYPPEWTVAVVEKQGAHDIFHIRGPYEPFVGVFAVFGYLLYAGFKDGAHE